MTEKEVELLLPTHRSECPWKHPCPLPCRCNEARTHISLGGHWKGPDEVAGQQALRGTVITSCVSCQNRAKPPPPPRAGDPSSPHPQDVGEGQVGMLDCLAHLAVPVSRVSGSL